jgi:hypothetical protein
MEKKILAVCEEKVGRFEQFGGACRQALLARCARVINKLSDDDFEALDPVIQQWGNSAIEAIKGHEEIDEFPDGDNPARGATEAADSADDEPAEETEEDMASKPTKKGAGKPAPAKATKKPAKPAEKKAAPAPAKAAKPKAKAASNGNGALESKPKRAKTNPGLGQGRKFVLSKKDHKIFVEVDANPKRAGSAAAARFDLYKNGMSVEKALDSGVTPLDISFDLARAYIRLEAPKE